MTTFTGTTPLPACITPALIQSAACMCGIGGRQADKIEVLLLCQIAQALIPSMACDIKSLIKQAACVCGVTGTPLELIKLTLLCNISAALGGGGPGSGLVSCGTAIPTTAPISPCALYIRKIPPNSTALYAWDGVQWEAIVGM